MTVLSVLGLLGLLLQVAPIHQEPAGPQQPAGQQQPAGGAYPAASGALATSQTPTPGGKDFDLTDGGTRQAPLVDRF